MFSICFGCLVAWLLFPMDLPDVSLYLPSSRYNELPPSYWVLSDADKYKMLYAIGFFATPHECATMVGTIGLSLMDSSSYTAFVHYLIFTHTLDYLTQFYVVVYPFHFIFFGFLKFSLVMIQQNEILHHILWSIHPSLVATPHFILEQLPESFAVVLSHKDPSTSQFWISYLSEVCYQDGASRGRLLYILGSHLSPTELHAFLHDVYVITGSDPDFFIKGKEVINAVNPDAFDLDHPFYKALSNLRR